MARWRQVLKPPATKREIRNHIRSRIQPFRASTLLSCGAVWVDGTGDKLVKVRDPKKAVEAGAKVYLDRPYPDACKKALEKNLAGQHLDYAIAPGTTPFDNAIRHTLSAIPGVKMLDDPTDPKDLEAFFQFLRFRAPRPIRNVYIGTHSWAGGSLLLPATAGHPQGTSFENLEELDTKFLISVTDAEVLPRPRRTTTTPRIPMDVHIRGCKIGDAKPWLQLLKQAIWSRIGDQSAVGVVTAPKHFQVAGKFGPPNGATEYMHYDFKVSSPARFTSRFRLIQEFQSKGFKTVDGNAIQAKNWQAWVPADIHKEAWTTTDIVLPLDGLKHKVRAQYTYRAQSALFHLKNPGPIPSGQAARRAFVLQEAQGGIANGLLPSFEDTHPFPVFRREGFASLKAYFDAFTWSPVAVSGDTYLRGWRHVYGIKRPIVDKSNRLYVNYYPVKSSGTKRIMMKESDSRFFESV